MRAWLSVFICWPYERSSEEADSEEVREESDDWERKIAISIQKTEADYREGQRKLFRGIEAEEELTIDDWPPG